MPEEISHTAPRADCPHPEWWHAPDEQATEAEVSEMVAGLVRATQPERVVETGTYDGHTTWAIADALEHNGHGRLWSFEIEEARVDAARHLLSVYENTEIVHGKLTEWEPPDLVPIDLAFIDSAMEVRAAEMRHLLAYGSTRALFIFHDTSYDWADELHEHPGLRCLYLPTPRGVTIAQVGPHVTRPSRTEAIDSIEVIAHHEEL